MAEIYFVELQFSFESCKFKIQKSKEGTGRVVMWNMGILNSYTMEVSTIIFIMTTLYLRDDMWLTVISL